MGALLPLQRVRFERFPSSALASTGGEGRVGPTTGGKTAAPARQSQAPSRVRSGLQEDRLPAKTHSPGKTTTVTGRSASVTIHTCVAQLTLHRL